MQPAETHRIGRSCGNHDLGPSTQPKWQRMLKPTVFPLHHCTQTSIRSHSSLSLLACRPMSLHECEQETYARNPPSESPPQVSDESRPPSVTFKLPAPVATTEQRPAISSTVLPTVQSQLDRIWREIQQLRAERLGSEAPPSYGDNRQSV